MEGNIYISGLIGNMGNEIGVELKDVISQVKTQPQAISFNVYINSEGGIVDTGFDIYNYLKSLQVPIKTIGSGIVASIATVIFMAGSERVLRQGTNFMIHLPMGGVDGTADEIESYSKEVRKTEDKLTKFYADLVDIDKEAVRALLKAETWLDANKAVELGFATSANLPIAAKAYLNTNSNKNMTKEDKSWIEEKFNSILNLFKSPIKNIMIIDSEGREIDFPTVEEGQDIKIGDTATIDGVAAEGEVILPNGQTLIFEGGALNDIKEPEAESEEESVEDLKAKIEELQLKQKQLTNEVATKDKSIEKMRGEILNFKKQITSKFDVDTKKEAKKTDAVELSPAKKALEAIINKRKIK